jgi:Bacteriocin-protection, YdeI or OmpD-Associated/Domain of unknown function (DUF1905)
MRFRAELQRTGGTTTGFEVPAEIVTGLGGGGRPKVTATVNGYSFRSSIAKMGGAYWLRGEAGVEGGQVLDVDVELDTAPREVELPADMRAALDADPAARDFWATVSPSNQRWHVDQLTSAKTEDTRSRRLAKSITLLAAGKAR